MSRLKEVVKVGVLFAGLYFPTTAFIDRFTISLPTTDSQCLKATLYLIDKKDKNIKQGDLVAFKFNKEDSIFEKGRNFIKITGALPGDTVQYTPYEIKVNDSQLDIINMLHVINFLNLEQKDFYKKYEIEKDELFVVGETMYSYDSRFWGTVNKSDVIGKAYAIF